MREIIAHIKRLVWKYRRKQYEMEYEKTRWRDAE